MVDDPYSILEVSRHATDEEIERAYRRLLNLFDPEHYPGSAQDARKAAIAQMLARLGFISEAAAHGRNLAVEVLAALLPPGADIGVCLTCVGVKSSGPYQCRERSGTFPGMRVEKHGVYGVGGSVQTIERSEIVLCTPDELLWTVSQYGGRGDTGFEDTVTLYSIPFEDILGAEAKGHKRDVVNVWIDDGPTVSIHTPPHEADTLREYIELAARQTD